MKVRKQTVRKKKTVPSLNEVIIQAIYDKKGANIITLDLSDIADAPTDYFIICDADNTTQVKAIAENIALHTQEAANEKPWHFEKSNNMEWLLIDYVNTVVHVFLDETRQFYQLEELWNDGILTEHKEQKTVIKPIKRKK